MYCDRSNPTAPRFARAAAVSSAAILLAATMCVAHAKEAIKPKPQPELMFVQLSQSIKVDEAKKTLRLVGVSPQTLYFADRPERIAGHVTMDQYLTEWTSKAGPDNFAKDPPNATVSLYEPGASQNSLAVVEITNPKVDGSDLTYNYKIIEGSLPADGGATSLFIDWIGVGGGVGVGFHGVGVGLRGPGLR